MQGGRPEAPSRPSRRLRRPARRPGSGVASSRRRGEGLRLRPGSPSRLRSGSECPGRRLRRRAVFLRPAPASREGPARADPAGVGLNSLSVAWPIMIARKVMVTGLNRGGPLGSTPKFAQNLLLLQDFWNNEGDQNSRPRYMTTRNLDTWKRALVVPSYSSNACAKWRIRVFSRASSFVSSALDDNKPVRAQKFPLCPESSLNSEDSDIRFE